MGDSSGFRQAAADCLKPHVGEALSNRRRENGIPFHEERPAFLSARPIHWGAIAGVMIAVAAAFWMLGTRGIQSGDYLQYIQRKEYGLKRALYHVREPGAVFLWQALTRCFPQGGSSGDSEFYISYERRKGGFVLLGCISGAFFILGISLFLRRAMAGEKCGRPAHHQTESRARLWKRLIFASLLALGGAIPVVFAGHYEFYAPLYAALAIYYWRAAEYDFGPSQRNFAWLMAAGVWAVTTHRAAAFHLPAILWMFRVNAANGAGAADPANKPAGPRTFLGFRAPRKFEIAWMAAAALAVCLPHILIMTVAAMNIVHVFVFEDYNWLPELLTPLTQAQADYVRAHSRLGSFHLFTFGSITHWRHFFFFLAAGSTLAAPVVFVWILKIVRYRLRIQSLDQFLLASAACGLLWALVWHPHFSYGDWDLFIHPSVPLNLLAARLILAAQIQAPRAENS